MTRRPLLKTALTLAFLVLVLPAARADEVVSDEWALMKMAGGEVGYIHTVTAKVDDPSGPLFRTDVESRIKMKRLGTAIQIDQASSTFEREDGRLVRATSRTTFSQQETTTEVTFVNGKAKIVTKILGTARETEVDCPADALGPWRLFQISKEKGLAPGTAYEMTTFASELSSAAVTSVKVVGPEEVELLDGTKATLTKVETTIDVMPIVSTAWVDADGRPMKSLTPVSGLEIETYFTTRERALAAMETGTELSPDVFAKTLVIANEYVPFARRADSALLRVSPRVKGGKVEIHADNRQEIVSREKDGSAVVRLKRLDPPEGTAGTFPIVNPPASLADSLAANAMIQSDEPEIVSTAKGAIGEGRDAWFAAQALEKFVYRAVTEKGMDVAFASALEVCRNRAGDCSEHAVFLTALLRAIGIPSRVVMGVEYVGGIWGGHAWSEAYVGGDWYALDGTLGYGSVDALHLSMSKLTMKEGSFGKEFAGLLQTLGNIEIEVLSIEYGGREIAIAENAPKVEGDRYVNRLWGFALTKPEGFDLEPTRPSARIGFEVLEIEGKNSAGKSCQIEVHLVDTPSVLNWTEILERGGSRKPVETVEATVDGRPARVATYRSGERESRVAFVVAGDLLAVFEMDRVEGEADENRFHELLRSVDFDVESRSN